MTQTAVTVTQRAHIRFSIPSDDTKICVVMVGLPARGKSLIAGKALRYLAWVGIAARIFNVGTYRREKSPHPVATFFDPHNSEGERMRRAAAEAAVSDMLKWFRQDNGVVAIFDATNSTKARRAWIHKTCEEAGIETLFVESLCDDEEIIMNNILEVKTTSPDYKGQDPEVAAQDFRNRIRNYEKVYETISEDEKSYTYVKLINVGSTVIINQIKDYLSSRLVYYIQNLHIKPRSIWLSRHGESEFNLTGKIGGDSDISSRGEAYARALPGLLKQSGVPPGAKLTIWTSTLKRTIQTARHLAAETGYEKLEWKALDELDSGVCDGLTYEDIAERYPEDFAARDEDKYNYRYRGGESYRDVVIRLEPIIMELERSENIIIVTHQAVLRCIYSYFHNMSQEQSPWMEVPLHTLIKLTPRAYGTEEKRFKANIPAVSTWRGKGSSAKHQEPGHYLEPRPLVELKPRDKSKIESILAYGDRLLVGLNNGNLRVYRVNEQAPARDVERNGHVVEDAAAAKDDQETTSASAKSTDLLREEDKFSRYKIDQLAFIKEANVLVSLSGGYVSLHDLQNYDPQEQLTKTKGATTFAVTSNVENDMETDVPSIVSRLAVAVKRKILLWTWQDMELNPDTAEITLVSGIKTLTWISGTRLIAGLTANYVLVDIETMELRDIVGPGSIGGGPGQESSRLGGVGVASMSYIGMGGIVPKPLATRLGEGQVLLAKDVNTHFIDIDGASLGKRQIPWNAAPEALGYSYPYLLALQDPYKGTLEIRNPDTLSLLQSISLPSASLLHMPHPNISLAHAGKGFLVASDRVIWRMDALSYDNQIDALVDSEYLDEAISLISMLEDALLADKSGRLREIQLQKAQKLFHDRKYRDALDLFAAVSAPPEIVIQLYPKIIAGNLSSIAEETGEIEENGANSSERTNGLHSHTEEAVADSSAPAKTSTYAPSLASFLRGKGDEGSDDGSIRGKPAENTQGEKHLEGKDLKAAVRELQGYLADVRRRFQRFLNPNGTLRAGSLHHGGEIDEFEESVRMLLGVSGEIDESDFEERLCENAKLVDTTLFRAHMYATPSLAGSLFRIANFCDPDVVMEKLEESGRDNELIDFYYGKKMHRRALELLRKFGHSQAKDENDDPSAHLRGPGRTVAYLQHLSPEYIDLILEFAEWPLREDPELGMEIFLTDTENAETLPRYQVIEFLEKADTGLAIRYLEHVIDELNDMSPDLHQKLLNLYLHRLLRHKQRQETFDSEDDFLSWKEKFLAFLKSSSQYSPAKVLDQLPREDPDFYEARAIAFSKMGQHRQALEIYVFKLHAHEKAEEYCNRIHVTEEATSTEVSPSQRLAPTDADETKPPIYLTLLSLYLSPPHGYDAQYGPALDILAKHGSRLPAKSTLNLIPEDIAVQNLEFYFRSRIRAASSIMNEARIVSNLQKVRNIKTQAQLLVGEGLPDNNKARSRHVTITEERVCGICYKRLGGSVISVFPDDKVVHLGCANRMT
ncbi:AvaB protein [Talaromyces proteolyticus]|uniref:fructose-2,6-bisphosphate 2-phosphatase n=1 Tax=Talaromyces proteolyticus TaxID=1131652 RepID=A0AAD4L4Y2_9EURO|nr:AvaB protein [Talaromyces proteolyticus]KAH8705968.1 AvaB protein [Talaromyces proteolyticus]